MAQVQGDSIEIFFRDLTPKAQKEVAKSLGYKTASECEADTNWEAFPMAMIPIPEPDGDGK
jgi:hypothetical protein